MPGPKQTLREYIADRQAQLCDLGGTVVDPRTLEFASGDATIMATVEFSKGSSRGTLTVFEHLRVLDGGRPTRWKYNYQVFVDGQLIVRFDRDPLGHPEMPEHKHVAGQERDRVPWQRVTLYDAVDALWETLNARALHTPEDE